MPSEAELGEETKKKYGKKSKIYTYTQKKKKDWPDLDFAGEAASQPAGSSSRAATDLAKTGLKNPTKASGPQETDSHWKTGGGETHDRRPKD